MNKSLKIAILLFDNVTALDFVGPYEVLSKMPNAEIHFVAKKVGLYSDSKGFQFKADLSTSDFDNPDILIVPGGFGIDDILNDQEILDWIIRVHLKTRWTLSVCSGAILLGAAGLLQNCEATTHQNRKKQLEPYCKKVLNSRFVVSGKIISSAGVSAGIDMALHLVGLELNETAAKSIQVAIEYFPQPPFMADRLTQ
jgi:aminopeptidase N